MCEQLCRGFIHFVQIERPVYLVGGVDSKRVFSERHAILVRSGQGIEAGMSCRQYGSDPSYGDVVGKQCIQMVTEIGRVIDHRVRIEMSDIVRCMDPRIGSPGSDCFGRPAQ